MAVADRSMLVAAAAAAAGGQQYPAPALYVVATPIGNLADLGLRALHVLALVDAIACEDTRHSARLLQHFGLSKPLLAAHEHNEHEAADAVLGRLARGERVAYISDAGTPAVSDPGAMLVAAAVAAGHRVVPVPGASSALAVLSVAGDFGADGFVVVGFLPTRGAERQAALNRAAAEARAVVLFEAPHRIASLAAALAEACADRTVTVGRELTKQFETIATMAASAFPAWLSADDDRSRGEFALVLHARPSTADEGTEAVDADDVLLLPLLRELPLKQAVSLAAEIGGAPRNRLYARALVLKQAAPGNDAA